MIDYKRPRLAPPYGHPQGVAVTLDWDRERLDFVYFTTLMMELECPTKVRDKIWELTKTSNRYTCLLLSKWAARLKDAEIQYLMGRAGVHITINYDYNTKSTMSWASYCYETASMLDSLGAFIAQSEGTKRTFAIVDIS